MSAGHRGEDDGDDGAEYSSWDDRVQEQDHYRREQDVADYSRGSNSRGWDSASYEDGSDVDDDAI